MTPNCLNYLYYLLGSDNRQKTYKDFIEFRQRDNPCVGALSAFLESYRLPTETCRMYSLDCTFIGGKDHLSPYQELQYYEIPSALAPPPTRRGRIVIVEDLHPSVLELLGTTLDIDPIFFA
ncbi:hypothetical protein F4813DRAFT_300732 [Daldinia decipiens]|uniref:uncharacterized protein n=1 Tax=Daldinia decipiens TaxID=326647 RepID=UPI0020C4EFB0|nr:uncharacterized protein F4813DRAFT_300732 [Daldinia decipiens]KAI1652727.1 hypothetical protein F4813DRAFT_300732 [Daldinia decipiens]